MQRTLFILLLAAILFSCTKSPKKDGYEKGRIEYKITYLNPEKSNIDPTLLPRKMVLEFNTDDCTYTIMGFMGVFQLSSFVDFNSQKSITYLKVFGKEYHYNGGKKELICCFDPMEDLLIDSDTSTSNIAGLNSLHATVSRKNTNEQFEICYTYDIGVEDPNATNPYNMIEGVLTKFRLSAGGLDMLFEAEKFLPGQAAKHQFEIPEKSKELNRQELTYVFNRLLTES